MKILRPKAVLIDFYGTISAGDHDAVQMTCRSVVETCNLAIAPSDFANQWGKRFFQTIEQCNHDRFRTLFECEASSLKATLADHQIELSDPDLHALLVELESYWADPPLYADAVDFLHRLSLPVCCVSNADAAPLSAAIERHGLRFNAVVTSQAARCYKPDRIIFQRAIEALGIPATHAVHIGDSRHSDIAGAAGLGIPTVWVRRENRVMDIGCEKPDYIIENLNELRFEV